MLKNEIPKKCGYNTFKFKNRDAENGDTYVSIEKVKEIADRLERSE